MGKFEVSSFRFDLFSDDELCFTDWLFLLEGFATLAFSSNSSLEEIVLRTRRVGVIEKFLAERSRLNLVLIGSAVDWDLMRPCPFSLL
jgi:hypothetical protein